MEDEPVPTFTRAFVPGGTFFFTVVTYGSRPIFKQALARRLLRRAFDEARRRRPFEVAAIVLLPEHLHCIWTLPADDHDFSMRWRKIKEDFTRSYRAAGGSEGTISAGQERKGLRGVWQPRFWEHVIRDERDCQRHVDYIHCNPVKHGYASCPHAWPWSSFDRWVKDNVYTHDWCCQGDERRGPPPSFEDIAVSTAE